jgi:hypothetical protein
LSKKCSKFVFEIIKTDLELYIMKHKGELLKKAVQMKFKSHTDAALALGVSRSTLYRYFVQEHIGDDLFLELGKKMGHDFRKDDDSVGSGFVEDSPSNLLNNLIDKSGPESVSLIVTIDGSESTLRMNIAKIQAIHELMRKQNFVESF